MILLDLILFILPAYFANAAPVFSKGTSTIDHGAKLQDGKPLLGPGKTWKGLLYGLVFGTIAAAIISQLLPNFLPQFTLNEKLIIGFLLSAGAMAGDLFGSFIKRRSGLERGANFPLMDQLFFLFAALIFALPIYIGKIEIEITDLALLTILTYAVHATANQIAYKLKLKKVPW